MRKRIIVAGILSITLSSAGLAWGATLAFLTKWGSYGSGQGQFMAPQGIAVGSGDEVFVSDTAHGIQVFSSIGVLLRQFGSGGSRSLAFGPSGRLYIVDVAAGGARVDVFAGDGSFVESWGVLGSADGQLYLPIGIAVDQTETVYVADSGNNRIEKFTSDGVFISKWGTSGTGPSQFTNREWLSVGRQGDIYATDDALRVQQFHADGTFVREWGSFGGGDGQFQGPKGMALDADGNLYVADFDRVQVFTSSGTYLAQFGSFGTGDGQLDNPFGVALDSAGDVYVLDSQNARVEKFSAAVTPTVRTSWGAVKARFR